MAYRYTGQEYDGESGLHNFRARLYDSDLGRFYAMDPAGRFTGLDMDGDASPKPGSSSHLSPYAYVLNNPTALIDPTGKVVDFSPFLNNFGDGAMAFAQDMISQFNTMLGGYGVTFGLNSETRLLEYSGTPSIDINAVGIWDSEHSAYLLAKLIQAIDSKDVLQVDKRKNGFGYNPITGRIYLDPGDLARREFSDGLNRLTMGSGMSFLHEFLHSSFGGELSDLYSNSNQTDIFNFEHTGPTVDFLNVFRQELTAETRTNFGIQLSYSGRYIPDGSGRGDDTRYWPFDQQSYKILLEFSRNFDVKWLGFFMSKGRKQ